MFRTNPQKTVSNVEKFWFYLYEQCKKTQNGRSINMLDRMSHFKGQNRIIRKTVHLILVIVTALKTNVFSSKLCDWREKLYIKCAGKTPQYFDFSIELQCNTNRYWIFLFHRHWNYANKKLTIKTCHKNCVCIDV